MRFFDLLLSLIGIIIFSPILVILLILGYFDTGSPLFFQKRMGKEKQIFNLVKFRSMKKDTRSVATHLVDKSKLTRYGAFIRKSKLDELPQLFNVFLGHMSLVGPRPNLPNQSELIMFREKLKVYSVRPGITGLSQIQKIDMSTPEELAISDSKMILKLDFRVYFYMLFLTLSGKGFGDRIIK
jgi:O-antigen biosynthesis protein WbqP